MRFMVIRKADAETEAETGPTAGVSEALITQMMAYNEMLVTAGVMLSGDGLHPSSRGARIKFSDGKAKVIDGPFAESKELVAGYSIWQCASREDAIEWLKQWPPLDANGNVELELRQIYEADDFGDAFTPELRAQNDRLRGLEKRNG